MYSQVASRVISTLTFVDSPDAYVFTPDDIAYLNAMEIERYEQEVPMSYYEKGLLRNAHTNSVHMPLPSPRW